VRLVLGGWMALAVADENAAGAVPHGTRRRRSPRPMEGPRQQSLANKKHKNYNVLEIGIALFLMMMMRILC